MYFVMVLTFAAILGVIPASIAKQKGYSFGEWWIYGWLLFIVAIIHVQFIPDKNASAAANIEDKSKENKESPNIKQISTQDPVEELKTYKELLDEGVITEKEFEAKKKQLLGI